MTDDSSIATEAEYSLSMVQVMYYNIVDNVLRNGAGRYQGGDS